MKKSFLQKLALRNTQGNLRQLQQPSSLIDFASNDYLGLARSAELTQCFMQEQANLSHSLMGSTGSRLLTGNSLYAQNLEAQIAHFHGYEAGLLFNCGYMANVGLLSTIASSQDVILFDASIHASMREGIRLSPATCFPFRHQNLNHLENRLKRHRGKCCFVCIESIYSTDGAVASLIEISQLVNKYQAHLIVDEAHAIGIEGPQGRGMIAQHQLMPQVFAHVHTFSKALGVQGAIILGGSALKEFLINFAHSAIYTTALPFYALAAIKSSHDLFPAFNLQREHLKKLIHLFVQSRPEASTTAIQSIPAGSNQRARELAENFKQKGFDVRALLSPTVQKGKEVLRICLHAFNTEDQVKELLECAQ